MDKNIIINIYIEIKDVIQKLMVKNMGSEKKKEKEEMKQQKKYIKERKEIIVSEENENSAVDAGEAEEISGAEGGFEHGE